MGFLDSIRKANEEKDLDLQKKSDFAGNAFAERDQGPAADTGYSERILEQGHVDTSRSGQKSIADIIAEKKRNGADPDATKKAQDKVETYDKIAYITGKLKNEGLVTEVQGTNEGAINLTEKEVEKLAKERTSEFTNTATFSQVKVSEKKKMSGVNNVSDAEAKKIAEGRVDSFANTSVFKQVNVSEKQRNETVTKGNEDLDAFEMIGRMVTGLSVTKKEENLEGEGEETNE